MSSYPMPTDHSPRSGKDTRMAQRDELQHELDTEDAYAVDRQATEDAEPAVTLNRRLPWQVRLTLGRVIGDRLNAKKTGSSD